MFWSIFASICLDLWGQLGAMLITFSLKWCSPLFCWVHIFFLFFDRPPHSWRHFGSILWRFGGWCWRLLVHGSSKFQTFWTLVSQLTSVVSMLKHFLYYDLVLEGLVGLRGAQRIFSAYVYIYMIEYDMTWYDIYIYIWYYIYVCNNYVYIYIYEKYIYYIVYSNMIEPKFIDRSCGQLGMVGTHSCWILHVWQAHRLMHGYIFAATSLPTTAACSSMHVCTTPWINLIFSYPPSGLI